MIELPDFHIPHAEKIEWMIETSGWAYESVPASGDTHPPTPSYGYSIGLPDLAGYPDIAIFGLTPAAGHGLLQMLVGLLVGGTELPIGPELVGVLTTTCAAGLRPSMPMPWNVGWQPRWRGIGVSPVQLCSSCTRTARATCPTRRVSSTGFATRNP